MMRCAWTEKPCPVEKKCLRQGCTALPGSAPSTPSMLEEAAAQVKQRRQVYGSPKPNFKRIADFWNVYWAHRMKNAHQAGEYISFNAVDVATMMRFVKEARLIETPDHRDSLVDIAGYADCHIECVAPGD